MFQGERMVVHAARCALAMQRKTAALPREHPDRHLAVGIGVINTGEVVMGAMGSRERMDYTVLGDAVTWRRGCARRLAPARR